MQVIHNYADEIYRDNTISESDAPLKLYQCARCE